MSQDESAFDLLERLRTGDAEAARRLDADYTWRLLGLARARLSNQPGARVEPQDVVQSVFATFFHHLPDAKWEVRDSEGLWRLLAQITAFKCYRKIRAQQAGKRNGAYQSLDAGGLDDSSAAWEPADSGPTPDEQAKVANLLDTLLGGCTPDEQTIVRMRLEGHEVKDIAKTTRLSERTVFRKLAILGNRLSALCGEAKDA